MTDVTYQNRTVEQNDEIIRSLKEMRDRDEHSDLAVTSALDNMRAALTSALRVPVAVVLIGAVSWLFYLSKITETTWSFFLVVAIFPQFGDSIRVVFELFRGNSRARERTVHGARLLAYAALGCSFFSGCATDPPAAGPEVSDQKSEVREDQAP